MPHHLSTCLLYHYCCVLTHCACGSDGEELEGPSVAGEMGGAEAAESELEPEVQELVQMVCNKQLLKDTMALLNIDTERFPLGKLSAVCLLRVIISNWRCYASC